MSAGVGGVRWSGGSVVWSWVGGGVAGTVVCCLGVGKNRLGMRLDRMHVRIKCLKLWARFGGWCVHWY